MALNNSKNQFIESYIDFYAPDLPGVYGLYDANYVVTYYGMSLTSIRNRLQFHFSGSDGHCTRFACFFNFESCPNPPVRKKELLDEFKLLHDGGLPKCNNLE